MTMRTYLEQRAKVFTTCPDELKINDVLALYRQIDELRAENKFLADTAAKLAKELKQADKLADALEVLLSLDNHHAIKDFMNAKKAAHEALEEYKLAQ